MAKKRSHARSRVGCPTASPSTSEETHNQNPASRSPVESPADSEASSQEPQSKRRANGTQVVAFKSPKLDAVSTIRPEAEWQNCALCDSRFLKVALFNEHLIECLKKYQISCHVRQVLAGVIDTVEEKMDKCVTIFECILCNVRLDSLTKMQNHHSYRHILYRKRCSVCLNVYVGSLDEHLDHCEGKTTQATAVNGHGDNADSGLDIITEEDLAVVCSQL